MPVRLPRISVAASPIAVANVAITGAGMRGLYATGCTYAGHSSSCDGELPDDRPRPEADHVSRISVRARRSGRQGGRMIESRPIEIAVETLASAPLPAVTQAAPVDPGASDEVNLG